METEIQDESELEEQMVYLPGQETDSNETELEMDQSAYKLFHSMSVEWPCLSFDVISAFPDVDTISTDEKASLSCVLVTGIQSDSLKQHKLLVLKYSNLHPFKIKKESTDDDDESSSDSSSDEDDDSDLKKPHVACTNFTHPHDRGNVNRIRYSTVSESKRLVATWSDRSKVHVWNICDMLLELDDAEDTETNKSGVRPLQTFGHASEGFALDWSSTVPGRLLAGDCSRSIHMWEPKESEWFVDQKPFLSHKSSVEDLQWSPNEASVFASCSVDKSIKIWDIRAPRDKACQITLPNAHKSDVNVISWNKSEPFLLSGGDDCVLNIWDLRQFDKNASPIALFKHHTKPITSVEWNPHDGSVFAASGEDDQLTIWDLAVERDSSDSSKQDEPDVPQQLLFIHQGQKEIKELHWHSQYTGVLVSTALSGFNIFRTISV